MSKFKVGDYITYEPNVGIQLAKIVHVDRGRIYALTIHKTGKHYNNSSTVDGITYGVNTRDTYESKHVWKAKFANTPLWKLLEGEDCSDEQIQDTKGSQND